MASDDMWPESCKCAWRECTRCPKETESIDDKLREILEDYGDYVTREERWTTPLRKGELTFVEQIKLAFADEDLKRYGEPIPADELTTWNVKTLGSKLMTGQEWYGAVDKAKLRDSIKNMVSTYNQFTGGERGLELLWPLIDGELKRAAGLEDK